ncbi:MAG TPA: RES family NAD+ phosphorylase [Chitinophagaceae bacterium]|nr:RES family NAD+ phosphorylase [Chitinophagaceae bacterium]
MLLYRIVHRNYIHLIPSGIEGRWNSAGNKVIYAAESIPLAFLETMIRRQGIGFSDQFRILFLEIPDNASISSINEKDLDPDWRESITLCQALGDQWYRKSSTVLLKVPSSVMPYSYNYLVNMQHPGSKQVKLQAVTELMPDHRIEEILKGFKNKS